jgi:hypothetical protein
MVRMRETDDPSRAPMAHAVAPQTKEQGRHHTDESLLQKAVREAVVKAGLTKIERNQQKIKGFTQLWQPFPRRVIRTGNQNSASYADQSNYCSAMYLAGKLISSLPI